MDDDPDGSQLPPPLQRYPQLRFVCMFYRIKSIALHVYTWHSFFSPLHSCHSFIEPCHCTTILTIPASCVMSPNSFLFFFDVRSVMTYPSSSSSSSSTISDDSNFHFPISRLRRVARHLRLFHSFPCMINNVPRRPSSISWSRILTPA